MAKITTHGGPTDKTQPADEAGDDQQEAPPAAEAQDPQVDDAPRGAANEPTQGEGEVSAVAPSTEGDGSTVLSADGATDFTPTHTGEDADGASREDKDAAEGEQFNPTDHNMGDVLHYLDQAHARGDQDEIDRVLDAERDGKNRKGIVGDGDA